MASSLLEEKIKTLVEESGVYLMKDSDGRIIYVGKAISLKRRVSQYFRPSKNHGPKVEAMVSNIADFDTIVTAGELEALILESNLIKQYRPYYNILLKDDKQYPYIRINTKEPFPRIEIVRRVANDGAR